MKTKTYSALEAIAHVRAIQPGDLISWDESSDLTQFTFEGWLDLCFDYVPQGNKTYKIIKVLE